jgi:hypothetical protein
MELKIFIPTLGRVNRQVTLRRMPEDLQRQVYLVVAPHEMNAYGTKAKLLSCPQQGKGLAAVREWILAYSIRHKFKRIVMMDDDLALQRRQKDGRILTASTGEEYHEAFAWLDSKLQTYAHASWGTRFLAYDDPREELIGGRALAVLGYNVAMLKAAKVSFTRGMSRYGQDDSHVTLQLLKQGYPNAISLEWRASPYQANAAGGCATYRTPETVAEAVDLMVKLHAPFVKARKKKAWKGMGTEEQLDMTIYWRKALEYGLQQRGGKK